MRCVDVTVSHFKVLGAKLGYVLTYKGFSTGSEIPNSNQIWVSFSPRASFIQSLYLKSLLIYKHDNGQFFYSQSLSQDKQSWRNSQIENLENVNEKNSDVKFDWHTR